MVLKFIMMVIYQLDQEWEAALHFTVGLLDNLLNKSEKLNTNKLAYAAIDTEQKIIGEFVGSQDQVAASYGGFNKIDFYNKNKFKVTPFNLKNKQIKEIEIILF